MDSVAIEGVAAVAAGAIIFCGSVFFLMSLVVGGKLAYFITVSVTLSFLLIMSLIWGFTNEQSPLGPVGKTPEWEQVSIGESVNELEGPSASSYPESPWTKPDEEDQAQTTQSAELQTSAADYLTKQLEAQKLPEETSDDIADSDSVRFLEQEGDLFGAVKLTDPAGKAPEVFALMKFDPGNPLGTGRKIAAGVLLLLIIHLVGLSFTERRARRVREEAATT